MISFINSLVLASSYISYPILSQEYLPELNTPGPEDGFSLLQRDPFLQRDLEDFKWEAVLIAAATNTKSLNLSDEIRHCLPFLNNALLIAEKFLKEPRTRRERAEAITAIVRQYVGSYFVETRRAAEDIGELIDNLNGSFLKVIRALFAYRPPISTTLNTFESAKPMPYQRSTDDTPRDLLYVAPNPPPSEKVISKKPESGNLQEANIFNRNEFYDELLAGTVRKLWNAPSGLIDEFIGFLKDLDELLVVQGEKDASDAIDVTVKQQEIDYQIQEDYYALGRKLLEQLEEREIIQLLNI